MALSGRFALLIAVAALMAACSTSPPADGSGNAPRTIEVRTSDELRFDPAQIEVIAGETVQFVVTNEGDAVHEFLIGTEAEQAEFAEDMAAGDSHAHSDAGVTVEPGQTETFEYTFEDADVELLAGCHEAGHYEAGMVASITVTD